MNASEQRGAAADLAAGASPAPFATPIRVDGIRLVGADQELILVAHGAYSEELEHIVMCVNHVAMSAGLSGNTKSLRSNVPGVDEFAKHWDNFPHRFKEALRANVRPCVSDAIKERNSCYLVGMISAYRDCKAIPDSAYSYGLALAGSAHRFDHIAAAIRAHWHADGFTRPPKDEKGPT